MNVLFKIKFKLKDNTNVKITSNLFLVPFYITEEDVFNMLPGDLKIKPSEIRQIIFNCSLIALRETRVLEKIQVLPDIDLFELRRDYTSCLVSQNLVNRIALESSGNKSKSKKLGDFSVSTSDKGDSAVAIKFLEQSEECIKELKKLIKDIQLSEVLPVAFNKGSETLDRLRPSKMWWLKEYSGYRNKYVAVDAFSSVKRYSIYNNKLLMKTGINLCFNNQRSYLLQNLRISFLQLKTVLQYKFLLYIEK